MIAIVAGAPGIGKTTISQALLARHGWPSFELSWIPEFRRMNGAALSFVEDERIAIEALIAVARTYRANGHAIVLLSDFREKGLEVVESMIPADESQLILLTTTDEKELRRRVCDEARPSGFRDWHAALEQNRKYRTWTKGTKIDVTGKTVSAICAEIEYSVARNMK